MLRNRRNQHTDQLIKGWTMKVIDLTETKPSIEEILIMARSDAVLINGTDGEQYILEEADEFEQEVAALGRSEKFMNFLRQRSEQKPGKPLSEIAKKLGMNL